MKEILLVGSISQDDEALNHIMNRNGYKILRANTANKAIKLLEQNSPDFVLCTGKIRQTEEGQYFLEI